MEVFVKYNYICQVEEVLQILQEQYQCEFAIVKNPFTRLDVVHFTHMSLQAKRYLQQFLGEPDFFPVSPGLLPLFQRPLFLNHFGVRFSVQLCLETRHDKQNQVGLTVQGSSTARKICLDYLTCMNHAAMNSDYSCDEVPNSDITVPANNASKSVAASNSHAPSLLPIYSSLIDLWNLYEFPSALLYDIAKFCPQNTLQILHCLMREMKKTGLVAYSDPTESGPSTAPTSSSSGPSNQHSVPIRVQPRASAAFVDLCEPDDHDLRVVDEVIDLSGDKHDHETIYIQDSSDEEPREVMISTTTNVNVNPDTSAGGRGLARSRKKSKQRRQPLQPSNPPISGHNANNGNTMKLYHPVPRRNLRPVIIDGQNVAHMYQMNVFNPMAIVYAVRYFQERGHQHITAIVPPRCGHFPVIQRLQNANLLRFVPTRLINNEVQASHDDLLIIETAIQVDGVILSNDQYRNETTFRPEYKEFVEKRLLMFYFSGKTLIIPHHVHGPNNPSLDEVLSFPTESNETTAEQHPTKRKKVRASSPLPSTTHVDVLFGSKTMK